MLWSRHAGTPARELRLESEGRAAQVQAEVVRPLREMRRRNHLSDALIADIHRQHREG